MMIVAVATVRNEVDIITSSIRHLLAEGVDRVIVTDHESTDGTNNVLIDLWRGVESLRLYINHSRSKYHEQAERTVEMADWAGKEWNADWILPFEADTFWVPLRHGSVREALESLPPTVHKVYGKVYQHSDWSHRDPGPTSMLQVAFRYRPGVKVAYGNHDAELPGLPPGQGCTHNLLAVREIPYRSYEHFKKKIADRLSTFDPKSPPHQGRHIKQLSGLDEVGLQGKWKVIQALRNVLDPIPTKLPPEWRMP